MRATGPRLFACRIHANGVAALLSFTVLGVGCTEGMNEMTVYPSPSPSVAPLIARASAPSWAFSPRAKQIGQQLTLSVTFPTGRRVELRFGDSLDISAWGVVPYATACARDLTIVRRSGLRFLRSGNAPVEAFRTRAGKAGLWEAPRGEAEYMLILRDAGWLVGVPYSELDSSSVAACAARLRTRVDSDGFLLVDDRPLSRSSSAQTRGQLLFGDVPEVPSLQISDEQCIPPTGGSVKDVNGISVEVARNFSSWCVPPAMVEIVLFADPETAVALATTLRVLDRSDK